MTIYKLNTACFKMYVLRNVTYPKTKLMIYYAMFYSILQYGIEICGSISSALAILFQVMYLRTMAFVPKRMPYKRLFGRFELLTLHYICIFFYVGVCGFLRATINNSVVTSCNKSSFQ